MRFFAQAALPCSALTLLTHVFLAPEAVDDVGARTPTARSLIALAARSGREDCDRLGH